MYIEINGERLIGDVQKDFTAMYPFLRIEFFRNGQSRNTRYPAHKRLQPGIKIKDAWARKKDSGTVQLTDGMTVLQLEKLFMDEFGLEVQVFRKSGAVWLETTMTDNWTLQRQNDHGSELSAVKKTGTSSSDFDLTRDSDH